MNRLFQVSILLAIFGYSKAHHFIRLVILAALGLAGLWMVHTLAQDFNNIQTTHGGSGGSKLLYKRSVDAINKSYPELNWQLILARDPAGCARSFLCQLAADDEDELDKTEKLILKMSRYSSQKDTWASKELQQAIKNGEDVKRPLQCMKIYRLCPYSSKTMLFLLKILGS